MATLIRVWLISCLLLLVACDGGNRSTPTANSVTRPTAIPFPTEPPFDEAIEALLTPQTTAAFDRDFEPRLSTPQPIFEEEEQPTADPQETVIVPTDTPISLFGTPFPTRAGIATSTPYSLSEPDFDS